MDIVKTFCPNLQALQGGNLLVDMDQKAMTSTYLDPVFNSFKSLCSQFGSLKTVWCDPVGAGGATCYVMRFTLKKQEEATLPLETPVKTSGKCGFEQSKGCTL